MKIDLLKVLNDLYPNGLSVNEDFFCDFMKDMPNGQAHITNLHSIKPMGNLYVEQELIKQIIKIVHELGYDPSFKYFSAITKNFNALGKEDSISHNSVIMVDDLLMSGLIDYYLTVLAWANDFGNLQNYEYCMINLIYILDMRCIKLSTGTVDYEKDKKWFQTIPGNILEISCDCYWVSWCFIVLHEIGHLVLGHNQTIENDPKKEFEADEFAYNVVIKLIEEYSKGKDKFNNEFFSIFQTYTCFAPMMFLDFLRIIEIFKELIYPNKKNVSKPKPETRIKELINIGVDTFSIDEGSAVYGDYLDVLDEFVSQLILKYCKGKLDILPGINTN